MPEFRVSLKWTKEGTTTIEAEDLSAAKSIASEKCLELTDDADPHAEITDWEVLGVREEK